MNANLCLALDGGHTHLSRSNALNFLETLGWNAQYQAEHNNNAPALLPARIIAVDRGSYLVASDTRSEPPHQRVSLAGKLRLAGPDTIAVGDWVALHDDRIDYVFNRRSSFVRKRVGESSAEQIIAANVDITIIATSLNDDFSLRRVERFVVAAWNAGTTPIILLTKVDLTPDSSAAIEALVDACAGCRILVVSAVSGQGVDEVRHAIGKGQTAVLVGSSGVGKSTLINALLGLKRQSTGTIRSGDAKGRHTTTRRELVVIPDTGGLIIDTPGMREFGVVAADDGEAFEQSFAEIEALAERCGFRDCAHHSEPNCAVLQAIDDGGLSADRLSSYFKLQRELAYNDRRSSVAQQRKEARAFAAKVRQHTKLRPKR